MKKMYSGILLLLLFSAGSYAQVNEYYVNGSSPVNGNGTAASPWNQIAYAVYRLRDTTKDAVVYIKGGTYLVDPAVPNSQVFIDASTSGANGKFLTFRPYPGDEGKVIFNGIKLKTVGYYPSMFIINGGKYVRIQNIVFKNLKNTSGQVINLLNAQSIEIKNCKFDSLRWTSTAAEAGYARTKDSTRYIDPVLIVNSNNVTLLNDTLKNSAIGWGEFPRQEGTNSGISVTGSINTGNTGVSGTYFVALNGNDTTGTGSISKPWRTVQQAVVLAGSNNRYFPVKLLNAPVTVNLRAGTHKPLTNGIFINDAIRPGNSQWFTIRNYLNENVILDGSSITAKFSALISISNSKFICIERLKLTKMTNDSALQYAAPSPGSKDTRFGIIVSGKSSNIIIRKNEIYDMKWTRNLAKQKTPTAFDNLNPLVILGSTDTAIRNVIIDSNTVYNNVPGYSEAVTVNGNVDSFALKSNYVFDNANIGICAAGNYQWIVDDPNFSVTAPFNYSKNGHIFGNTVYRNISPVAVSAGIYLDGSRNVKVENNLSYNNGTGISIGNEQYNSVSGYHTVQSNVCEENLSAGLYYGSTNASSWVENCTVKNNTIQNNYVLDSVLRAKANNQYGITNASQRYTEVNIYRLRNSIFEQNTIESLSDIVLGLYLTNTNNILRYNTYYVMSGSACQAFFVQDKNNDNSIALPTDSIYSSFHRYALRTGLDQTSSCEGQVYSPAGCGTARMVQPVMVKGDAPAMTENEFIVYPSPAYNEINIRSNNDLVGFSYMELRDMTGRIVLNQSIKLAKGTKLISIREIKQKSVRPGLYSIILYGEKARKTFKISVL